MCKYKSAGGQRAVFLLELLSEVSVWPACVRGWGGPGLQEEAGPRPPQGSRGEAAVQGRRPCIVFLVLEPWFKFPI